LGEFFAEGDAPGDADEVGVLEFDAGAFVAVVEEGIDALGAEGVVEVEGGGALGFVGEVDGGEDDFEGGDGGGHGDAVGIVEEFDGAAEDAFDADAVGAHDDAGFLAFFVEDGEAHGIGVFIAELEDVADFHGFENFEGGAGVEFGIAGLDLADVGEGGGEVFTGGDVEEVVVVFIGAGDEVFAAFEGLVGVDGDICDTDGAEGAGVGAEEGADFLGVGGAEFLGAGGGEELGFAELVIAAEQGDEGGVFVAEGGDEDEGFDAGGGGEIEEGGDFVDGFLIGGVDLGGGEVGVVVGQGGGSGAGDGFFEIGGVAGLAADDDIIFTGIGGDHELLAGGAAHGAGVGFDDDIIEAAALEDAAVGLAVFFVGEVEAGGGQVEGVGVLHGELAGA